MGLLDSGGGQADILLAREAERAEREIDLRFLKDILHFIFWDEDRDVNVHSDCQVVRDMEVEAGELMCCKTSGANQI